MSVDWGPIVAGAVSGLGAGVVASLIAPWVQLAVEKRRERLAHRRKLIEAWRDMIARSHKAGHVATDIVEDPDFLTLRPHLSAAVRARLEQEPGSERKPLEIVQGATGISVNADLSLIASEVDRIEREWKLR